jgi:hypothetical protein
MSPKMPRELTEADLEKARQRALVAPPLPDDVRRQLVLLIQRQDTLPEDYRSLVGLIPSPSGWVLTHLMPLLFKKLASDLRKDSRQSSLIVAQRLEQAEVFIKKSIPRAVHVLVEPLPSGVGSKKAGDVQLTVLRILDLGILGFPVVCAVYARHLGVLDTSTVLISEGVLSIEEALEGSFRLDDVQTWEISKGDIENGKSIYLPKELLPPDNFNSVPLG